MKNRHALFLLLFISLLTLAILAANVASAGTVQDRASARSARSLPAAPPYVTFLPFVVKPGDTASANALWRFGAGKAQQSTPIGNYAPGLLDLRLGWYTDFLATANAPEPYGIEYVYTVRVKQWKLITGTLTWTNGGCPNCDYVTPYTYTVSPSLATIADMASAQHGKTWLIGNEIERRDWNNVDGFQDEILPELYAKAYHDIYFTIKNADPTAQVAIGGMIQATPLRLKYLDRVWNGYSLAYSNTVSPTMPIDIWNIHAFILPEVRNGLGADIPAGLTEQSGITYSDPYAAHTNFNIAAGNIGDLRTWMKNHNQQNKPLYISEYGVLYPTISAAQVRNDFMVPSFNYFLNHADSNLGYAADGNRLVQRWSWYSLDDDSTTGGFQNLNGNLNYSGLSAPQGSGHLLGLTTLGNYWHTFVQPLASGASKPYAPQPPANQPRLLSNDNATLTSTSDIANCPEDHRVRLLYFERPTRSGAYLNNLGATPRLQDEKTICVP